MRNNNHHAVKEALQRERERWRESEKERGGECVVRRAESKHR